MRKSLRTLIIGVLAIFALGILSACSGGSSTEPAAPSESSAAAPTAFPASAKYMADMEADGKKMTIGIAVDGDDVTAYACNGTDDEAWFFGNQTDGAIDITGKFRDTLSASFNGNDVTGDLTMNGVSYDFTAAPVPAPAGMYTAALDNVRSSWIVRPDGSVTGVVFTGPFGGGDGDTQFERQQQDLLEFQERVRNKRILGSADDEVELEEGKLKSKINGRDVTAEVVVGDTRFN